jgi:hypothetical protein
MANGDLTLSFGRDVVNAEFTDGHNVQELIQQEMFIHLSTIKVTFFSKLI